ncbi:hypothetical protein BGW38_010598 [Lunasporangiospora selenospora]|uniref:ATP-dependent (S)-NAD(P)H-hydrate dehydratase n=1 Tax=Lunasporangiospora selenospora TaxID=979761 RepID=A0A9P6KHR6_9FUNG|nr:hypothetical protein BGW38_010598 [Lunasporangiospora selenospora]
MSSISKKQREAFATTPLFQAYRSLVPPLSEALHKGQGGRIGVFGGSSDYTGAPFFSGMAALRLGADLGHIICDQDAATAIKSYSPDLIVHPYLQIRSLTELMQQIDREENSSRLKKLEEQLKAKWNEVYGNIDDLLKRLHVLVVGPGLSRDSLMLHFASHTIQEARKLQMPIIIDADGLYLVQSQPGLVQGYSKAVLTPNLVEFERLCKAMSIDPNSVEPEEPPVVKLSQAFEGAIVIQKGKWDVISDGKKVHVVDREGGLKRSGGQGDILTGVLATSLGWGLAYQKNVWSHAMDVPQEDITMTACFGACHIVRACSWVAYGKHRRALQSSDVLAEVGPFFDRLYSEEDPTLVW